MARQEAVVTIVENGNDVLLVKKAELPGHWFSGKWHIPGETLEDGESDNEGMLRGIMEEAGIEIEVPEKYSEAVSLWPPEVRKYFGLID